MNKIYDLEGKNKAIVLFKFFAALLITYSHMALLFPKYSGLVTGGAIGDGLFFFCSGFTLFLGRDGGFMNWYKRRVSRIYPSIIMWALLSAVAFGWIWNVIDLITTPRYWFIPCIMVYYAIFYLIRRFLMRYMKVVFYGAFILITILSFFILDMNNSVMYAQVSFMRIYYFMFMLLGAITALDLQKTDDQMIFGGLRRFAVRGGYLNEELRIKNEESVGLRPIGNEELRIKNEESVGLRPIGNEELRIKNEESVGLRPIGNEELRIKNEESVGLRPIGNEELRIKNEESVGLRPIGNEELRINNEESVGFRPIGNEELRIRGEELSAKKSFLLFFGSLVLYYACMAIYKLGAFWCHFQMVSLIPLLLAIYYFFMLCSCKKMVMVFDKPWMGNVVYFISALTLEIYLVQYALFTDKMNFVFPLNLPVMYLMIFGVAYALKCLSQVFSQVFGGGEFEVKGIFKI